MASSSLAIDTATSTWWVLVCLFLCSLHDFFPCKTPPEIGELIGIPNTGRLVHSLIHNFPKLQYVKLGISFGIFLAHTTFIADCKHRCNPSPVPSSVSTFPLYLTSDGTKRFTVERKRSSSLLRMLMAKSFSSTIRSSSVNVMQRMSTMSNSRSPCLNLFLLTTISLSSQTVGRCACPFLQTPHPSQEIPATHPIAWPAGSTSLSFAQQGVWGDLFLNDPDLQQDSDAGVPGFVYLGWECVHWGAHLEQRGYMHWVSPASTLE